MYSIHGEKATTFMFDLSAQIQHYAPMLFSDKIYIGV